MSDRVLCTIIAKNYVALYLRTYYRRLPAANRAAASFEELEELARADSPMIEEAELTEAAELETIRNSRAWRWVFRYGRFKHRFLQPVYDLFRRIVRRRVKSINSPVLLHPSYRE